MTRSEAVEFLTGLAALYPSSPFLRMTPDGQRIAAVAWAAEFPDAPLEAVRQAARVAGEQRPASGRDFPPSAANVRAALTAMHAAVSGVHAEPVGPAEFEDRVGRVLRASPARRPERIEEQAAGLPFLRAWLLGRDLAGLSRRPLDRDGAPDAAPHEWKRLHDDYATTARAGKPLRQLEQAAERAGLRRLDPLAGIPGPARQLQPPDLSEREA